MSRYVYRYPITMLMDLGPGRPATAHWPMYSEPPPHLLVGYQYAVRACNDYIFDTRAYSRLRFHEILAPSQQLVNWSMLCNCAYSIDTGAYHRFVDLDNFGETLAQVQQAVLAERVAADLGALRPLAGTGRPDDAAAPVDRLLDESYRRIADCREQGWGMAERVRAHMSDRRDLLILRTVRRLKTAYFNYLVASRRPRAPALSLPCDSDWLYAFLERFGDRPPEQPWNEGDTVDVIKCAIDALSLPRGRPLPSRMAGGAMELREREDGRAVTQHMRRARGEMVRRFIESLPLPTRRRRRAATPVSPSPPPEAAEEEEEEEDAAAAVAPSFQDEIRAAVVEAIALLEDELTVAARDHAFFGFVVDFYEAMRRAEEERDVSESLLRRWVMYFFVAEHVATTLNYLHARLRHDRAFARNVDLGLAQVVMRARDADGRVAYSRVWNEAGVDAFPSLMRRVSQDLAATVARAGVGEMAEEEVDQFMADIAYQERSGDVGEILRQAAANDVAIDSIELSFRFKLTGPVVFAQRARIQDINRRVVAEATRRRRAFQELPAMNARLPLPPRPAA